MMKKSILFLAATAVLALAGCNPEAKPPPASSPPATKSPEAQSASLAAPKADVKPSPAAPAAKPDALETGKRKPATPSAPDPRDKAIPANLLNASKALEKMTVPEPSQKEWRTSDLTPAQIASGADDALASLRGAYAEAKMLLRSSQGSGQTFSKMEVQDPSHFSVQFVELSDGRPHSSSARADGHRRAVSSFTSGGKWVAAAPVGKEGTIPAGSELIARWPSQFPRLALAPILESRRAFSAYVNALSAAGGYSLSSQRRDMPFQGQLVTSYRIVAERTQRNAQQLGPSRIEMVFDGNYHLPVTIRTSVQPPKGQPLEMFWTVTWGFQRTFDPKDFQLPSG